MSHLCAFETKKSGREVLSETGSWPIWCAPSTSLRESRQRGCKKETANASSREDVLLAEELDELFPGNDDARVARDRVD